MSLVGKAFANSATEEQALSTLAGDLREATAADSCDILLTVEGGGLLVKASTSLPELSDRLRIGRGVGFAGHVVESGEPLVVPEKASQHPLFAQWPGIDAPNAVAAVAVPLGLEDERIGAIVLEWHTPQEDLRDALNVAMDVAGSLGLAIQVFRSAFEAGSHLNRLGLLAEVTDTLSGTPYLEEILQHLVNITARRFNYRVVSLRLLDETGGNLILRAAFSIHRAYPRRPVIKLGESIAGKVIQRQVPIIVEDVQTEEDFIGHDLAVEQGLRSMICVPLKLYQRAVGVMSCYTGEVRQFPPDEVGTLETLAKQAAVAIEHAKAQVRNTLLQEMHHRVKNNLQQVASLLRLQIRSATSKPLPEALTETLSRIEAIAAVHDLLSREDLDHVGLKTLSETLIQHQQQSFMLPAKAVGFSVRGSDVLLTTTQATQVALILNELIQNAVSHGFQVTDEGEVHVTIEDTDGKIDLWVSNNGDALPTDFKPREGGLGLTIIDGLARSLGGRFSLENKLGWTVAHVQFTRTTGE
ncbi:MAG: GAF domain-containing protein [Armatimonadetes bacterium]|nr:GAF domain-containing protein [Armatimonadota bacterium]